MYLIELVCSHVRYQAKLLTGETVNSSMTFQTHFPRLTLFLFSQGNQYAQQVTNQVLPDNCPATGHESYVLYLRQLKFTVYIMHIAMVTKLPNKAGLRVLSYLHIACNALECLQL